MDFPVNRALAPLAGRTDGSFVGRIMGSPHVLIVDDDQGTRDVVSIGLRLAGFAPVAAASAAEAIRCARSCRFTAAILDLRLPDMSGTDLASALHGAGLGCPFLLVSGWLTTRAIVEAMRLGATEVLDKPVDLDELCAAVRRIVDVAERERPAPPPSEAVHSTAAERWAHLIVCVCHADRDPKTLQAWAHLAGLSYTSLRELCRILGIRAHDARDLARMLRALMLARRQHCPPAMYLDVRDLRTLRLLFGRAGIDPLTVAIDRSLDEFLDRQTFVDARHPALVALRASLALSSAV
jgi:FixJ family two-component response regulator